jgi:hypothetical protein
VVSYEDKAVCVPQWPKTYGEGNLRCLVKNTIIKFSFIENETALDNKGTY